MRQFSHRMGKREFPAYQVKNLVIGSGCAGFNAADTLYDYGEKDVIIVTEGINMGTSRNTGSDKQTFYKLSLSSDEADSVGEMAKTLFECGGIHGDIAMVEASCSVRSFLKLANYGVPFPTNRYGAYIGYKTDHDPRCRATSAGPYTSKYMTECLERSVRAKDIKILDNMSVVRLLVEHGRCYGVIAVNDKSSELESGGITFILAENVILATGGPAGVYSASVYPESQTGMTGMAIEAGAAMQNMMDWQYGLASVKFRWNVSGTYQQALPRYISVDPEGNEREFLLDYYSSAADAANMVFLKGYQWPFDVRKLDGSSMIDVLVYRENQKGNRVYMDFTRDPSGLLEEFALLSQECQEYLMRSGAVMARPIERLNQMNAPAVSLYQDHGIDLWKEPLEIHVCAQHCCGGVAVDADWQTTIPHLYAVGEAAGNFGAYRPGGTALASGQTGSLRAAEHIAFRNSEPVCEGMLNEDEAAAAFIHAALALLNGRETEMSIRQEAREEFTKWAAHIRNRSEIEQLLEKRMGQIPEFFKVAVYGKKRGLSQLLRDRDILLTQGAILSAILLSIDQMGSRGSGLAADPNHPDEFLPSKGENQSRCIITHFNGTAFLSEVKSVRPLPQCDDWFETNWKEYRERRKKRMEK